MMEDDKIEWNWLFKWNESKCSWVEVCILFWALKKWEKSDRFPWLLLLTQHFKKESHMHSGFSLKSWLLKNTNKLAAKIQRNSWNLAIGNNLKVHITWVLTQLIQIMIFLEAWILQVAESSLPLPVSQSFFYCGVNPIINNFFLELLNI